jgi:hypothetical protein
MDLKWSLNDLGQAYYLYRLLKSVSLVMVIISS